MRATVALALLATVLLPLSGDADVPSELVSASFSLLAPTLSGGGGIDLESSAPVPTVRAHGVTIGQSGPLGVSTGAETGIELRSGFWHVVSTPAPEPVDSDADGVADDDDNCPLLPNADQADADMNDVGDVCECSGPETFPGDGNSDGFVDGADYTVWADGFGLQGDHGPAGGDYNCDGSTDGGDYTIWADRFGSESPF